jgi:hypothetical protein
MFTLSSHIHIHSPFMFTARLSFWLLPNWWRRTLVGGSHKTVNTGTKAPPALGARAIFLAQPLLDITEGEVYGDRRA